MPVTDLGVRKAMQKMYSLPELPKPPEMLKISQPWKPHRTIAIYGNQFKIPNLWLEGRMFICAFAFVFVFHPYSLALLYETLHLQYLARILPEFSKLLVKFFLNRYLLIGCVTVRHNLLVSYWDGKLLGLKNKTMS